MAETVDDIAILRRFNRSYTQRVGVLAETYLDTGRPLGPARVLFEIGDDGRRVGELRRELGLDSGYLSRLLRQLEQEGLITLERDPADGRQRIARLSTKGRRERRRLDHRAQQLAERLVDALPDRRRAELSSALTVAERLLRAATVDVDLVDPGSFEARFALSEYFEELDRRFSTGFNAGHAAAATPSTSFRAPQGAFFVLHSDQEVIGCGGVQIIDGGGAGSSGVRTAEIKRMWIHSGWRGLGLGGRLLARLEDTGRELGAARAVLDTNGSLLEAITMYQHAGYHSIRRYNDNPYAQRWFAKPL